MYGKGKELSKLKINNLKKTKIIALGKIKIRKIRNHR